MHKMSEAEYHGYRDRLVGLCCECGAERGSTEPDAEDYPCEACGQDTVYGIEQLMLMGQIEIT